MAGDAAPAGRRRSGGWLMGIGLLLVLAGAAPLLLAMLASWIAELNACALHEGFTNPCLVLGMDIGSALYTMFVMGWLMLLTIWLVPAGLIVLIFGVVRRLRRGDAGPRPDAP